MWVDQGSSFSITGVPNSELMLLDSQLLTPGLGGAQLPFPQAAPLDTFFILDVLIESQSGILIFSFCLHQSAFNVSIVRHSQATQPSLTLHTIACAYA